MCLLNEALRIHYPVSYTGIHLSCQKNLPAILRIKDCVDKIIFSRLLSNWIQPLSLPSAFEKASPKPFLSF
jgi:hypothetical protein